MTKSQFTVKFSDLCDPYESGIEMIKCAEEVWYGGFNELDEDEQIQLVNAVRHSFEKEAGKLSNLFVRKTVKQTVKRKPTAQSAAEVFKVNTKLGPLQGQTAGRAQGLSYGYQRQAF